jgi:hypothetical protein
MKAAILNIAHFRRVTTVKHLLDDDVKVGSVVAFEGTLEPLPVVAEDLLEGILVNVNFVAHIGQLYPT